MSGRYETGGSRHWAQINEVSFVTGMRLLFWICRTFGRWPFRMVLYPVLAWYVMTKPLARRASSGYLRRVSRFGGQPHVQAGITNVMRHFAAFAECILDKMLLWGKLVGVENISFFGEQQLEDDIAAKRGGLLICSHFGNLELCRVMARRRAGMKLTVLVHTKHAQKFNQLLAQLDPDSQLNLLQVTELSPATAMLLSERVARGEFVVIAGDRVPVTPGSRTCDAMFLGDRASFPIGPYVLASLLQCPVYMLFSMRIGQRSEIHFEKLRDSICLPRKDREQAFIPLVQDYAARLEHFCLRTPFQWFNFYDFWQSADRK
ncbi:acyltransferase [Noviherbaspirillum saxi]|uniref:Acyltransferase n=1 Tax=Noviherbaspirillum saxi TaxID=2320863 RepID=A0A3A3FP26_9BURK|nr:acyltransferase [Noviherbaspirillum saxi]RJF97210.1 acyltransferase [Noviherbaspirillum saxi]